ncbi:MAG: hypothetical protein DRP51_03235 [Candidatus Zixiibacteriota bacterium]|nr:MAG: hypothetical protein DRP51_03235 [candidate division Zixibacteria bacterium]HHI02047.1 hypothetical protein [candidate division Zixibacteria bacterium]
MKKLKKNDGFSILEVMVSIIILTLSLVLLLNMAMVALTANNWSNQATMSTQILQEKLEELRTTMILANGVDTVNNIEREWQIDSVNNHLRRINIAATWINDRGDTLNNSMTTYIRTPFI